MEKRTKMDAEIDDVKLRLSHTDHQIMLLLREKEVLRKQLDTLENIKNDKLLA
jgi:hypothetical protein